MRSFAHKTPKESAVASSSYSLTFVGQSLIKEDVLAHDEQDFRDVVSLIRSSDFAFTGYEGTIRGAHGGWPMKSTFLHASEPPVLDSLKNVGFNLLSLSNNHAFDLGPNGVLSTLEEVQARGFTCAGIGHTLTAATRAGIARAERGALALIAMDAGPQGEHVYAMDATERIPSRPGSNRLRVNTTIAMREADLAMLRAVSDELGHEQAKAADRKVGFKQIPGKGYEFFGLRLEAAEKPEHRRGAEPEDVERNLRAIADAAAQSDRVIVYVHHHHWEPRWEQVPPWFRQFAHECIDAGAGAVVSHGVPMLQGMEIYKGAPLLFGLGNFIFHTYQPTKYTDERIWQSVVAKTFFSGGELERVELYPIVLGGEDALLNDRYDARRVPHLARGAYGTAILERMASMSETFGTRVEIEEGRGIVRVS
jgi:poly-gamma-glutamate synthesis protein (capsule biosynthesis protein)